ncbi:hypothetical protein [Formivibrio citricus]|uniref:hypothetical protein n=1 Tax=Formivibrio citricus TaxID=83765 RepID=UPI000B81D60F|nr:hypothetical protein [Formivibrio citricus]
MNSARLSRIGDLLNEDGLNYSVFLRAYEVAAREDLSSSELICLALGPSVVIGGIRDIAAAEVPPEVEASLTYVGDSGARPSANVLNSVHFKNLLTEILADLHKTITESQRVEQFWLKDGHPAYPVFWDFAYLFRSSNKVTIFIGSSSD